jgi:hypothetical protein
VHIDMEIGLLLMYLVFAVALNFVLGYSLPL